MGGGTAAAEPPPATTTINHHSPPQFSSTVSPLSSNFYPESSHFVDQTNFGSVPSQNEVQNAIFDLRRVMNGFRATNSEINGVGQIMEQCSYDSSGILMMKSLGQKRLVDAYHLLQTDASVQRLVLSISSDTKVWDSILKNDAVQDLQASLSKSAKEEGTSNETEIDATSLIVTRIFEIMKSKILDFIEKLEGLVFETRESGSKTKKSASRLDDILEEKVRSSLLLSVVVLMIVVVTRSIDA